MAAPHVAGIAVIMILWLGFANFAAMSHINSNSQGIVDVPSRTSNLLALTGINAPEKYTDKLYRLAGPAPSTGIAKSNFSNTAYEVEGPVRHNGDALTQLLYRLERNASTDLELEEEIEIPSEGGEGQVGPLTKSDIPLQWFVTAWDQADGNETGCTGEPVASCTGSQNSNCIKTNGRAQCLTAHTVHGDHMCRVSVFDDSECRLGASFSGDFFGKFEERLALMAANTSFKSFTVACYHEETDLDHLNSCSQALRSS